MPKPYQVAALPIRRSSSDGRVEVLLVTSRETRRWVVPKGWPWRRVADHDAAAGEAWEEAGVRGRISPDSIGAFTYDKRRRDKLKSLRVRVFLLEVDDEADAWPEVAERRRGWFGTVEAADLVAEPELKAILMALGG